MSDGLPMVLALLELAAKSALLLVAAVFTASGMRTTTASVRHYFWSAVVLGVLILPLASFVLPSWHAELWRFAGSALPEGPMDLQSNGDDRRESVDRSMTAADRPTSAPDKHDGVPFTRSDFLRVLLASALVLYLAGAAALLLVLSRAVANLRRTAARGRPLTRDDPRQRTLDAVSARLGSPRRVELVQSTSCEVPYVWGFRAPVIVLPTESSTWSNARLESVFLHELAHVRQYDVPLRLAAEMMCVLHWFNPLAWLAARRLRVEGEAAADDAVVAAGVAAEIYAAELLALGIEHKRRHRAASAMAGDSLLGRRVDAILDASRRGQSAQPFIRMIVAFGVLGLLAPIASISLAVVPVGEANEMSPGSADARTSVVPVQLRWSAGAKLGALFTEGSVDLDATNASLSTGFLLLVDRVRGGELRSLHAVSRPGVPTDRALRQAGAREAPDLIENGWLPAALEVAGTKLGGLGSSIRWNGQPLGREGVPRQVPGITGSIMSGLPASSEDGGRGTLVLGWSTDSGRAGLFVCAAPGTEYESVAARALLRRLEEGHGRLDLVGAGECVVAFTWDRNRGSLHVFEAYRATGDPVRVRMTVDTQPTSTAGQEAWLSALIASVPQFVGL